MAETALMLAVFGLIAYVLLKPKPFSPPKTAPSNEQTYRQFEAAGSLFVNQAEQALFNVILEELPPHLHVMSKVRLEDIIRVRSALKNTRLGWQLRGRVKSRHVDFLIIDRSGHPILAIELDGSSHRSENSQNADNLKNGLFKAANIPLKRIKVGSNFVKEINHFFANF